MNNDELLKILKEHLERPKEQVKPAEPQPQFLEPPPEIRDWGRKEAIIFCMMVGGCFLFVLGYWLWRFVL